MKELKDFGIRGKKFRAIMFLVLKVSLSLWDTSEPWGNDYREEEVTIEIEKQVFKIEGDDCYRGPP